MGKRTLGEKLKLLRGTRTQENVSNALGLSRARYSHYENNRVEPDMDILKRLAEFYNTTTDYLLGVEEHNKTTNSNSISTETITSDKDERDIAKRLEAFKEEIENSDGLAFDGEPMSDEAKESLAEAMEHLFRQTQRINKKYIPKQHRE